MINWEKCGRNDLSIAISGSQGGGYEDDSLEYNAV
jgi:hypothetical protein